jgi:hypothetical protein
VERRELDEAGLLGGLHPLQDVAERHADPGHHHRPRLDAAQPVDPLFELVRLDQVVELVVGRLVAVPVHLHRPRPGGQTPPMPLRVALVAPELVEVVVAGDLLERVEPLVGPERTGRRGPERGDGGLGRHQVAAARLRQGTPCGRERRAGDADERSSVEVDPLLGDF